MIVNKELLEELFNQFDPLYQQRIEEAIAKIIAAKNENQKICVVTGSGPNIHEGITTFIAELINKGIIDGGVLTSSAVVAHEMAGSLDKVKRIDADLIQFPKSPVSMALGNKFELTELTPDELNGINAEISLDMDFISQLDELEGQTIIKAAGNMAYPMGLRTEMFAKDLLNLSTNKFSGKQPLECLAGLCADEKTMIGAGAKNKVPVMVSIPQMIGGGEVGLCVGDSIQIHDRCERVSQILGQSSVIIESGLALAQEIHDGPFETYTGHGIWSEWLGHSTYTLKDKALIRFDLDTNLEKVWQQERNSGLVQQAITQGKPKTKLTGVPFRMEMSGFARLETSIPIIGDIGRLWPIIMSRVAEELGIQLDFISYPQETDEGKAMREFIVENVQYLNRQKYDDLCQGAIDIE